MSIFDSLYTLDENQVLGEGATCKVKFATKNETDEQCAVKIFDRNAMRDDPTITESDVRREATLFKFLSDPESHPHIVKCHGYYQDSPDYLYLVFEYLSGGELFDQIASKHNYTEKEVKHLAKTILEAIQFVHQKNIIHRDLKPQNLVLVDKNSTIVKLIDFGFAGRIKSEDDEYENPDLQNSLTESIYTPGFGAPEVLAGEPYGKEIDMWSFGIILYQLLTGKLPFGDYSTIDELFDAYDAYQNDLFPSVDGWDQISSEAKDFLSKLLTLIPDDRLSSNQALNHPWFTSTNDDTLEANDLSKAVEGIKSYQGSRFKRAVKKVMAANIFKKLIGGKNSTLVARAKKEAAEAQSQSVDNEHKQEEVIVSENGATTVVITTTTTTTTTTTQVEEVEGEGEDEVVKTEDVVVVEEVVTTEVVKEVKEETQQIVTTTSTSLTKEDDPYLKYGGYYAGDIKDTADFKYVTWNELPHFTPAHKSLMSKVLTKELFDKLKNIRSSKGYTLSNVIMTGVVTPHLGVGCTAGDEECWELFKDLFYPVIKEWHGYDAYTQTHPIDLDPSKLSFTKEQEILFNQYVVSTRIRAARNISGFALPPGTTEIERAGVENVLKQAFHGLSGELSGNYYELNHLTTEQTEFLLKHGFLFQIPSSRNLLTGAGAARSWPNNRGIFHNQNQTILCWVNEEDHCRIISMDIGGNISSVFQRFCLLSNALQESATKNGTKLMWNEKLGFLGTCPSNLGTGLRASVMIQLPEFNKLMENGDHHDKELLELVCSAYDLQPRGSAGEHSPAIDSKFDISNKQRLGFSEVQLVQKMIDGVTKVIKLEQLLAAGSSPADIRALLAKEKEVAAKVEMPKEEPKPVAVPVPAPAPVVSVATTTTSTTTNDNTPIKPSTSIASLTAKYSSPSAAPISPSFIPMKKVNSLDGDRSPSVDANTSGKYKKPANSWIKSGTQSNDEGVETSPKASTKPVAAPAKAPPSIALRSPAAAAPGPSYSYSASSAPPPATAAPVNAKKEEVKAESTPVPAEPVVPAIIYLDSSTNKFPYETLKTSLPTGVDPARKEDYLDDETFQQVFGTVDRKTLAGMQKWKRDQLKKKVGLF